MDNKTGRSKTKGACARGKDLLESIEMEPVPGERAFENGRLIQNRAYYVAHSNVETLAL